MVERHLGHGICTCMMAPMCQSLGPKYRARRTGMEVDITVWTNVGPETGTLELSVSVIRVTTSHLPSWLLFYSQCPTGGVQ